MRYRVTVSSPGLAPKTYEVEAESELAAVAKASGRYIRDSPTTKRFEISAVVLVQRR